MPFASVPSKCMADAEIDVEVAYARPDMQRIYTLRLPLQATVRDAIEACGVLSEFPEIDLSRNKVGVFGKRVILEYALHAQDRVEIYRPLLIDPQQASKLRAAQR